MNENKKKYIEIFYLISFFFFSFLFAFQSFNEMPKYDHAIESEILYDYWFENEFQWGEEIVQNIGPYGWIHFPKTFTGFLDLENILMHIFLTIISIFIFFEFSKHFNEKQKIIYQFIFVFVQSQNIVLFFDPVIYNNHLASVSIYESTNYVIFFLAFINMINEKSIFKLLIYIFFTSLYALGKGVFLIQFLFFLPLVLFLRSKKFPLKDNILIFLLFLLNLSIMWIVANQDPKNFFNFIISSFNFSSGYQYTLHGHKFFMDLATVSIFLILIIVSLTKSIREILKDLQIKIFSYHFCYFLMEGLFIFAVFKHSIICSRPYHASIMFWVFLLIIYPFIFLNFAGNKVKSYS